MTTIEDFTSQYGLVQKIDAFGYMKYLAENPDAPRKHGKVVLVTADTPLKASRGEGKTTSRAWASPQPVPRAVPPAAARLP